MTLRHPLSVSPRRATFSALRSTAAALCAAVAFIFISAGCVSTPTTSAQLATASAPPPQILQAGDVVKIVFPGASAMDTTQQIRRDGKLNLNLVGEVQAAGKTPTELETQLTSLYSNQIVSKEVKVLVVSSSFSVFVTGAVVKPGKIQPDHALTAFEAIMEAGGFDFQSANTREVRIIRIQGDETQTFTLNLKDVLDGKPTKPFYLRANDTIYVPSKLQLF